jgi:hypothetical protein
MKSLVCRAYYYRNTKPVVKEMHCDHTDRLYIYDTSSRVC